MTKTSPRSSTATTTTTTTTRSSCVHAIYRYVFVGAICFHFGCIVGSHFQCSSSSSSGGGDGYNIHNMIPPPKWVACHDTLKDMPIGVDCDVLWKGGRSNNNNDSFHNNNRYNNSNNNNNNSKEEGDNKCDCNGSPTSSSLTNHIDENQSASTMKHNALNSNGEYLNRDTHVDDNNVQNSDVVAKFGSEVEIVSKNSFMNEFPSYGFPTSGGTGYGYGARRSEENVMILYSNKDAKASDTSSLVSAKDATSKCEELNIVTIQSRVKNHCVAIVKNNNSASNMHVQRYLPDGEGKLELVGRGKKDKQDDFAPPFWGQTKFHWEILARYFLVADDILSRLDVILKRIQRNNTVVVLTTNSGHASMLMNFVCSCRARGFSLDNALVFATDRDVHQVARDLGLESFYDDSIFGHIPSKAAKSYGDNDYAKIMFAKVLSPHLVNVLGYDILFMDVDVVWYKDPVPLFQDKNNPLFEFDMLFQDDSARSLRFAPYAANSGFFFARHNERTRYFFISMLYHADMIQRTRSHQAVVASLLPEFNSLVGLKVKTLQDTDFPGGFHYLRRKDMMRRIVQGKESPWIFHMHWTASIKDKLRYMKQFGIWYVEDRCTFDGEVLVSDSETCCSATPLVTCTYLDLPSVEHCKGKKHKSVRNKGAMSFW